jgi:hypothetical protein
MLSRRGFLIGTGSFADGDAAGGWKRGDVVDTPTGARRLSHIYLADYTGQPLEVRASAHYIRKAGGWTISPDRVVVLLTLADEEDVA